MDEVISINVRLNFVTRLVDININDAKEASKIVTKSEWKDISVLFELKVLNWLNFSVFEAFELDPSSYVSFDFHNNLRAPINAEQLPRLVMQHKNSGSFYIEILLEQPTLSLKAEVNWSYDAFIIDCHNLIFFFIGYSQLFDRYGQRSSIGRVWIAWWFVEKFTQTVDGWNGWFHERNIGKYRHKWGSRYKIANQI